MNAKQTAALTQLIDSFGKYRGFNNIQTVTAVQPNGSVQVIFDMPGFPTVSIGKQGGYGLPEIKSYPENGKESCFAFPGNTALDAALWADKHLERQASGKRSRKALPVVAASVPVTVPDPFAGVEMIENTEVSTELAEQVQN